jgi:hypothetical protein
VLAECASSTNSQNQTLQNCSWPHELRKGLCGTPPGVWAKTEGGSTGNLTIETELVAQLARHGGHPFQSPSCVCLAEVRHEPSARSCPAGNSSLIVSLKDQSGALLSPKWFQRPLMAWGSTQPAQVWVVATDKRTSCSFRDRGGLHPSQERGDVTLDVDSPQPRVLRSRTTATIEAFAPASCRNCQFSVRQCSDL